MTVTVSVSVITPAQWPVRIADGYVWPIAEVLAGDVRASDPSGEV